MKVIPLTDFVHNTIRAVEGHPIEIPDGTAADLEKAGLVRIGVGAVAAGKSPDDGTGQPSSVSPAAPVSPITTSSVSKRGVAKAKGKKGK